MKRLSFFGAAACALALVTAACGSSKPAASVAGSTTARIDPAGYVARVDNPWFPLTPGTTFVYRGAKDGQPARDVFTVTSATKAIQGVRCTAVSDRLYLRGKLHERTTDWYAQDKDGNVWYFGEATAELDAHGKVTSREGSWQSGVDGARAGIYMSAQPKVGSSFLQEYYKGHAEDHFQALSLTAKVEVPYISSKRALLTKEWTPLEPAVLSEKVYVRGVGMVKEEDVKGGDERSVLVAVTRA
jgi:hypothetical protein